MTPFSKPLFLLAAGLFLQTRVLAQAPIIFSGSNAQDSPRTTAPMQVVKKPLVKKPKSIANELSFGIRLNTDGWSIFADRGYVVTEETKYREMFHDVRVFQAELGERKHPKEIRSTINGDPQRTKPFVYGKVANFYPFKLGYGKRKMIAGKPESGTVSVHWVYVGGLALGLEKPYYIQAMVLDRNTGRFSQETIKYSEETKEPFLTEELIVGAAGFSEGLKEIKFVPGVQAKTGLHFDFSQRKKTKLALEIGLNGELYTRRIQMMANQKALPYAANVYASVQFGKRW